MGLIAAAVESLATRLLDDAEKTYRKGEMIEALEPPNHKGLVTLIDLTARQDTPGYAADPTWAATAGSISIDSVGTDDAEIYVDSAKLWPQKRAYSLRPPGTAGYNAEDSDLAAPNWWYKYGSTEGESVTVFHNDTAFIR